VSEVVTPLAQRVLKNGESKFTFGPDHTVADICRHLHGEDCAEEAIYILRELLGLKKFKVRVVGRYYTLLETKVVTVEAIDKRSAQFKTKNMSDFDLIDEVEIIED